MMRLGIVNKETWGFFNEIYSDLQKHYDTTAFHRWTLGLPMASKRVPITTLRYALDRFMRQNDAVFFEWASDLLATASHLPKRCKIITRLHRYELYAWADKVNWDHVDGIILVSKAKQREFSERFPDHAAKTYVVSPSTSLDRFTPHSKPFTGDIGILCHLTARKRVYELILDFYELQQNQSSLKLHIAGGASPWELAYHEALHSIVKRLRLQDKVIFYGATSKPERWYQKIDIFVSNSYSEGLQVAPMEAMASGCYCLSHWWEGADELLPEENLFFTGNELNEKILSYCQLSSAAKERQRAMMRSIARDRFDINKTIREIRSIVHRTASN